MILQEFRKEWYAALVSEGKVGEGVSISFICEDALAIYRAITPGRIQATQPFLGNGMWVTVLVDTDGYQLLFESPTTYQRR